MSDGLIDHKPFISADPGDREPVSHGYESITNDNKEVAALQKRTEDLPSPKEKKRTAGNIIYDFGVFGTIAWAGVALLSALSAHESKFGNNKYFGWLRAINNGAEKWMNEKFSQTILKNSSKETVEGYSKGTTMFLTLGMGGNALMAPIKWLEDNRQKNAAKIDNLLGTIPPEPDSIANEPKQSWKSVLTGRLFSWGGSYLAFLGMGPKLTGEINDAVGAKATETWLKFRPKADPVKVRRWADIAAFDAIFTAITASATYLISRFVAKKEGKKIDGEDALFEVNMADPHVITSILDKKNHTKQEIAEENEPEQKFTRNIKSRSKNDTHLPKTLLEHVSRPEPNQSFSPAL